jgi:dTDP-4-amino-4,6-dideoxygalactose transaminase
MTKSAPAGAQAMIMPFLDLRAQFATIREEVFAAVTRTFRWPAIYSGSGSRCVENDIAELTGCKYAIACASGTDALILALLALGIGPGDEVITTPFTFVASAGSVARVGAKPVFVDIDADTFNVDLAAIEKAVTSRTKAIVPVHLFGLTAEMDQINAIAGGREIPVIEYAAQAIGARYREREAGYLSLMGCFSFFRRKILAGPATVEW